MRVQVTDSQIRSWRLRGFSLERIARACGSTTSAISHRIQRIWQEDQERAGTFGDPDEAEIRRRCAEIQREWSDQERQKREVGRAKSWRPVVVPVSLRELVHD
jgi:IS30 family transposase